MIPLLTHRLAGPVATAAAAVLLVLLVAAQLQIGGLKRDVARLTDRIEHPRTGLQARLATCRAEARGLRGSLDRQSAAVAAWKAEADARQRAAEKAAHDARVVAESLRRRVAEILAARPGENVCASADALILESLP